MAGFTELSFLNMVKQPFRVDEFVDFCPNIARFKVSEAYENPPEPQTDVAQNREMKKKKISKMNTKMKIDRLNPRPWKFSRAMVFRCFFSEKISQLIGIIPLMPTRFSGEKNHRWDGH